MDTSISLSLDTKSFQTTVEYADDFPRISQQHFFTSSVIPF